MKLLYEPTTRDVWYAVDEILINTFVHTTNLPLSEFLIDEKNDTVINLDVRLDLRRTQFKFNAQGQRKYQLLDGAEGLELHARDGWQELRI